MSSCMKEIEHSCFLKGKILLDMENNTTSCLKIVHILPLINAFAFRNYNLVTILNN